MFSAIRSKLRSRGAQFAMAGFFMTWGARRLVELTRESSEQLAELVELHADTRTRIFVLETLEESRRAIHGEPPLHAADDELHTEPTTFTEDNSQ